MVGDKGSVCPLPNGKVSGVGIVLPSHFAVPIGTAVWLATLVRCLSASSLRTASFLCWLPLSDASGILFATVLRHFLCKLFQSDAAGIISFLLTAFVRCRWHPLCKRPIIIFFANCPYPMPLASFGWLPLSKIFNLSSLKNSSIHSSDWKKDCIFADSSTHYT